MDFKFQARRKHSAIVPRRCAPIDYTLTRSSRRVPGELELRVTQSFDHDSGFTITTKFKRHSRVKLRIRSNRRRRDGRRQPSPQLGEPWTRDSSVISSRFVLEPARRPTTSTDDCAPTCTRSTRAGKVEERKAAARKVERILSEAIFRE